MAGERPQQREEETASSAQRAGARPVLFGLLLVALFALALPGLVSASSYSGSGDWVIPALSSEVVRGDSINVTGNLTVLGTLELVNSTVVLDRNASVSGTLRLSNSTLTFTTDGPGTNYLVAAGGSRFEILDYDGSIATPLDASVLSATPFAFNSSFAAGSSLTIRNSRVNNAGWVRQAAPTMQPGFRLSGSQVDVSGSIFRNGFELFVLENVTGARIGNSSFDAFVSGVNLTGGAGHLIQNLSFVNHTFGVRLYLANSTVVNGVFSGPTAAISYSPPRAAPPGTLLTADRVQDFELLNLSVFGQPSASPPRQVYGFVLRNSTRVAVNFSQLSTGDSPGHIFDSRNVTVYVLRATDFANPLMVANCREVLLFGFILTGERAGIEAANVTNLTAQLVEAASLAVPVLRGTQLSGRTSILDFAARNVIGLLNFSVVQGSLDLRNLTGADVTYGATLDSLAVDPLAIDGVTIGQATSTAIAVDGSVGSARFLNLDVETTDGWALQVVSPSLQGVTIAQVTANNTDAGAIRLNCRFLDNLSVSAIRSSYLYGPMLLAEVSAHASNVTLAGFYASNTTGSLIDLRVESATNIRIADLYLVGGDQLPPSLSEAAVSVVARPVTGPASLNAIEVDGLYVNSSFRGGVYLESPRSGLPSVVTNASFEGIQLAGVRVVSANTTWDLVVSNIRYISSGTEAALLEYVRGVRILNVTALGSPVGIELRGAEAIFIENLTHDGFYASVLADASAQITVRNLTATSGYGLELTSTVDVLVEDALVSAGQWAFRVTTGSNVTLRGFNAISSTRGIAFRNVTGATAFSPRIEFSVSGIVIELGARDIALASPELRSPANTTAGTALRISSSANVSITNATFRGLCLQAATVDGSTRVALDRFVLQSCGKGVSIILSTFVAITNLSAPGAFNGSALVISSSSDVSVVGADLSRASESGFILTGATRLSLRSINASGAGSDAGLLAFVTNTTLEAVMLDDAGGAGFRAIYAGPSVTLSNASVRRCSAGIEFLIASNMTLLSVDVSYNRGYGVYLDGASFNNLLRNLTLRGNAYNGFLVLTNRTRLIDGNVSGNGEAGLQSAPGVRLDWVIEVSGSLADETIDLTGDIEVRGGASFLARASTIRIDQRARLAAFEPYAMLHVYPGAGLTLDGVTLRTNDPSVPFSIMFDEGSSGAITSSDLVGGGKTNPASSFTARASLLDITGTDFSSWGAPLDFFGENLRLSFSNFSSCSVGPRIFSGNATLDSVSSDRGAGDGLLVTGASSLAARWVSTSFNAGVGLILQSVGSVSLDHFQALNNSLGGLLVTDSDLTGSSFAVSNSGAVAVRVDRGARFAVDGLSVRLNAGAGVTITGTASVTLSSLTVTGNAGSGVVLDSVGVANLTGGTVGGNGAFGLHSLSIGVLNLEALAFTGDAQVGLRVEGATTARVSNSSFESDADQAVVFLGDSNGVLQDVSVLAAVSGVLATDQSRVYLLNCSQANATALLNAEVTFGWFLRVVVQTSSGNPASGVLVNVTNASGASVSSGLTDVWGSSRLIPVPERTVFSDRTEIIFGPEDATAYSPSEGRARTSVNVTRYTTLGMTLDPVVPKTTVSFDGFAGQNGWFVSPVGVSLSVTDDRAGGITLDYRVGQGPWERSASGDASLITTVTASSEGITRIEYWAQDAAGNTEPLTWADVRVDLSKPTVEFVPLASTVFSSEFDLNWSADDGLGSGVESFIVNYSFNEGPYIRWLDGITATSARFSAQDGDYKFRITAYDRSGQPSVPAFLSVTVALHGSLRVLVADEAGRPIENATVRIAGTNVILTGTGEFELRDLLAGNYIVVIYAPGFEPVLLNATVRPHELTDLGVVKLLALTQPAVVDITAASLVLAAFVLMVATYGFYIRQKWARRKDKF